MIGRETQTETMHSILKDEKSAFVAVTGRRRVGKTYLIDQVYANYISLRVTGIQKGDMETQIINFTQKIAEVANFPIISAPKTWQDVFILLKSYLHQLTRHKKRVIFIDELPWIATAKSQFIQLLAHLWNDYLSKENHFILVICGSSTSWIAQKIQADKGGFHNRITNSLHLDPFSLRESKAFLQSRGVNLVNNSISELYMCLGGVPYYLEQVLKAESPSEAIERICFHKHGMLHNEYDHLYKALFDNPESHEAIVAALAESNQGMSRQEILKKTKIAAGGPYTRAMQDLIISGFVIEVKPYGKRKRGAVYRLIDEYSIFYHRFLKSHRRSESGIWLKLSRSQSYRIWLGYAFENLCFRHVKEIKVALGISGVYSESFSYCHREKNEKGFQIDLGLERSDSINLCECKFYSDNFETTADYAEQLRYRRTVFQGLTREKKNIFITLITNYPLKENKYSLAEVDSHIDLSQLM